MNSILIIDDEKEICESIKMILEYEGYDVQYSIKSTEGVEKAVNEKYEALLLDIQMPEMNGFEVLKKVKEINPAISANHDFCSRQRRKCN